MTNTTTNIQKSKKGHITKHTIQKETNKQQNKNNNTRTTTHTKRKHNIQTQQHTYKKQ